MVAAAILAYYSVDFDETVENGGDPQVQSPSRP